MMLARLTPPLFTIVASAMIGDRQQSLGWLVLTGTLGFVVFAFYIAPMLGVSRMARVGFALGSGALAVKQFTAAIIYFNGQASHAGSSTWIVVLNVLIDLGLWTGIYGALRVGRRVL